MSILQKDLYIEGNLGTNFTVDALNTNLYEDTGTSNKVEIEITGIKNGVAGQKFINSYADLIDIPLHIRKHENTGANEDLFINVNQLGNIQCSIRPVAGITTKMPEDILKDGDIFTATYDGTNFLIEGANVQVVANGGFGGGGGPSQEEDLYLEIDIVDLQDTLDSLPKNINSRVLISVISESDPYEVIHIEDFKGFGELVVYGWGAAISNLVIANNTIQRMQVWSFKIGFRATEISNCTGSLRITGLIDDRDSGYGIRMHDCALIELSECQMSNKWVIAYELLGPGLVFMRNCYFDNYDDVAFFVGDGCVMAIHNIPDGVRYVERNGGKILQSTMLRQYNIENDSTRYEFVLRAPSPDGVLLPDTLVLRSYNVETVMESDKKIWGEHNHGSGSGLDADMLDGKHAADFAPVSLDHHNIGAKNANDLPSTWPVGIYYSAVYNNGFPVAYGHCLTITGNGAAKTQLCQSWPGQDGGGSDIWIRGKRDTGADAWGAWAKLWSQGNQGTGSGLDADLLDGKHAADFLPLTGGGLSGNISITSPGVNLVLYNNGAPSGTYSYIEMATDVCNITTRNDVAGTSRQLQVRTPQTGSLADAITFVSGSGGVGTYYRIWGTHNLPVESGNFTPTLEASSGGLNVTYSNQIGYYRRIKDICYVGLQVAVSSVNAQGSGILLISGFPYSCYGTNAPGPNVIYMKPNQAYFNENDLHLGVGTAFGYPTKLELVFSTLAGPFVFGCAIVDNTFNIMIGGTYVISPPTREVMFEYEFEDKEYHIDSVTDCGEFSLLTIDENNNYHRRAYVPTDSIVDLPEIAQEKIKALWTDDVNTAYQEMVNAAERMNPIKAMPIDQEPQPSMSDKISDLQSQIDELKALVQSLTNGATQ